MSFDPFFSIDLNKTYQSPPPPTTSRLTQDDEKMSRVSRKLFDSPVRAVLACNGQTTDTLKAIRHSYKQGQATLKASGQGSSGFTLLGKAPSTVLPQTVAQHVSDESSVGFVLKWVPIHDADNELTCTDLAQFFGLEAPAMRKIEKETSSLFVTPTRKEKPAFNPEPFQLLAMNRIQGMNLHDLCQSGGVFKLNQKAWNQMMEAFGKAAIFDLFIGNFDRFFRFRQNDSGSFELVEAPEANPGNVLVHTTPQKGNVAAVSFIDSTSMIQGSKPVKKDEEEEFMGLGMFDDAPAPDPETPPQTPRAQKPSINPKLAEGLHAFFVKMIEEEPDVLANHICKAVSNSLKACITDSIPNEADPRLSEVWERIADSTPSLVQGIQLGVLKLNEKEFQEGVMKASEQASDSLKLLLRSNLAWLASLKKKN
ncbi:MAG: hypothetical protein K1X28_06955 [Parachlamydiales bacterium]|nr:hypothetical protein [Parachlamydiales bacterium]